MSKSGNGKYKAAKLKRHPIGDRIPEASPAEFEALKETIRDGGQEQPIDLYEGMVLDGWHRYRACLELGIEPKFRPFKGDHARAVQYVVARLTHRSLSDGQRCYCAGKFAKDLADGRTADKPDLSGKSRDIAALHFAVSPRNVQNALFLMKRSPKLFEQLRTERGYNVNRAMQEWRRQERKEKTLNAAKASEADLSACRLVHGDCLEELAKLPRNSARVIFADPPYNIGKHYDGDATGDKRKDEDFLAFCQRWLAECREVLAPDGSIFVMLNNRYAARVEVIMRALGLLRRNTIFWWENNPENQQGNFSDAVRQILYFTKTESFVWNDDVRVDSRRKEIGDKRAIDTGKLPDNVWIEGRIPGNSLDRVPFTDAPPQLPVSIPATCIKVASNPGDLVIDPFNGNGTTAIAAIQAGRQYIGIDKSGKYLRQSEQWIKAQLAAAAE